MREPDVTLTDFALAAECVLLSGLLIAKPGHSPLVFWFAAFFIATGVASLLGGLFHGFLQPDSTAGSWMWTGTLMAIGVAAAAGWLIGTAIFFEHWTAAIAALAAIQFAIYASVVLFVNRDFGLAVANYLPSTIFLASAYALAFHSNPTQRLALGLAGIVVMVVAAAGQRLRIGLHPRYFTHNALFHLGQGIALYLLFLSVWG